MKHRKPAESPQINQKKRRVRFYAVVYLTALMTLSAPLTSVENPRVKPLQVVIVKTDFKAFARQFAGEKHGWDKSQFICLGKLWGKESAWKPTAKSPTHDYGIPQRHMKGKSEAQISAFLSNPKGQIEWGVGYIVHRYETACNALSFHKRNNWY